MFEKVAIPTNDSLIPRSIALRDIFHIAPSTAWRMEGNDPAFPKPVKIGARVFYRRSDIDRYIASGVRPAPRKAANAIQHLVGESKAPRAASKAKSAQTGGSQ